jgi:hypothetical protein
MKVRGYIFCVASSVLFCYLNVQPLLHHKDVEQKQTSCQSKCSKSKDTEKEDDCRNEGCNPFVPCYMGSCCYLVENFYSASNILPAKKVKPGLFDDNTILNKSGECWHPPETRS